MSAAASSTTTSSTARAQGRGGRYTTLTGTFAAAPRWDAGLHQCRYSYYPESKCRFIADNFRQRHIPADTLWLDIHYLEGFAPLTWDLTRSRTTRS
jgi:alpha-glucosidase